MTWNIRTGGGDRLPAIIEVVRAVRPDILALQELRDFPGYGDRRLTGLATAVGMTAHLVRSVFGQPVAVLVRPPLRIARRSGVRWRLHHAAAEATVPTTAGPLTVVSTHLNPISPYRRMREARFLAARHAGRGLTVITGDLNGLAPGDPAPLADLPAVYRRRHLGPDGEPDTRAVAAFLSAGFTDLAGTDLAGTDLPGSDLPGSDLAGTDLAGTDLPGSRDLGITDLGGTAADLSTVPTTGLAAAEFGRMRLDYVLAAPAVAARAHDLHVIRGGAAEHASDHYPVRVDLDL
ncbi:endonuclease/exonuclease/phosphatase family protein [Actinoplanes sp. DH11]|uniref:endonuclease/exonuclease/phosphatase family protein n=1 Tax=Actinoplanes sp. DH11 TaxID=2857011 RepID=UPI001E3DE094|nr:endonuclease/exonuclease/phosphatase family protein [Actinoplanes sp. DH11]